MKWNIKHPYIHITENKSSSNIIKETKCYQISCFSQRHLGVNCIVLLDIILNVNFFFYLQKHNFHSILLCPVKSNKLFHSTYGNL